MLLTIPQITKGSPATVSLSKSALFDLVSDDYFSTQSNVSKATVVYMSSTGNQREILTFNLADESPQATFHLSVHARSTFLLSRLILEDFDGGTLTLKREQLPTGLDVSAT